MASVNIRYQSPPPPINNACRITESSEGTLAKLRTIAKSPEKAISEALNPNTDIIEILKISIANNGIIKTLLMAA